MKKQQGFTLIELLVVIAIIGILSSIVIASLGSARTRGSVSAVKAGLGQLRTQAEVYIDVVGGGSGYAITTLATPCTVNVNASGLSSYSPAAASSTSACVFADPVVRNQLSEVASEAISGGTQTVVGTVSLDGQRWAVSTRLKNNRWVCIDNQGASIDSATYVSATATTAGTCV